MDKTTKRMVSRSWKPYVDKASGKWLTGYAEGYAKKVRDPKVEDHEVRILEIEPTSIGNGILFEDREGYVYEMSHVGSLTLVEAIIDGRMTGVGTFLLGKFKQVKKGGKLFIEVAEDNEK
jgi:hypothetical protein